jgi:hypothetical protein
MVDLGLFDIYLTVDTVLWSHNIDGLALGEAAAKHS